MDGHNPLAYILLLKSIVILIGVALIVLGYWVTKRDLTSDFDFKSKIGALIEMSLKGSKPGLFIMLLGAIIVLAALLYRIEAEYVEHRLVEHEEVAPAEKLPITLPPELADTQPERADE